MQHHENKIDAGLLGKIVLARFLELPLRAFDRLVTRTESCAEFAALRPWVTVGQLKGAQVVHDASVFSQNQTSPVLGEIREASRGLMFLYYRASYVREYRFDEEGVKQLMSCPDFPRERASLLRLINTRNRLTHALIGGTGIASGVSAFRAGFGALASDPSGNFRPAVLGVDAFCGRRSRPNFPVGACLVPRAAERRSSASGQTFPKPRQIHCHFVDHVIQKEKYGCSRVPCGSR